MSERFTNSSTQNIRSTWEESQDSQLSSGSTLRRSKRASKPIDAYCQTHIEKKKILVTELDEQRGLDQPGRNYNLTQEDKQRKIDEFKGREVYEEYLKPAGWVHRKHVSETYRPDSSYVYLASKDLSKANAVEGVNMFYEFDEIYHKWISDEDFRKTYQGGDEDTSSSEEDSEAPSFVSNAAVAGIEFYEYDNIVDYDELGQPTLGVPAAARLPVESTDYAEREEEERSVASHRLTKHGRSNDGASSTKQRQNKRQKTRLQMMDPPPMPTLSTSEEATSTTRFNHFPSSQLSREQELQARLKEEDLEIEMLKKQIEKEKLKKELAKLRRENGET